MARTRFDIVTGRKTDRWFVTVDNGDIAVTRQPSHADCVHPRGQGALRQGGGGKLNAVAAVLRGDLEVEGDWRLLVRMQRLFPGPAVLSAKASGCVNDGLVKILDGNTFVVSDASGDIEASLTDPTGLFSYDTRFLSRWVLTVNGERLNPLSVDDLQYFEARFFLVPGTGTVYIDAKLSVIRQRAVADRLPRGAHDPEPRRQAGRRSRSASTPAATSPTSSR